MEVASVPGGEAAEPQAPAEAAQEAPAPAIDPQRFESVESRLGEVSDGMRALMARIPEQAPEAEPDFAEQFEELYEQTAGAPDAQSLQQLVNQQAERIVEQKMAPFVQQFQQFQQGASAEKLDALQAQYPEYQDPQKASELVDEVVTRAAAWGNPELAQNPEFVEQVLLARQARAMPQETPAGQGPEAHLETGGGAGPVEPEANPWDAIKAAGQSKPLF